MIGQSYALYRPAQYDNKRAGRSSLFWSSARGRMELIPSLRQAENMDSSLQCSNNSRNGPMGDNFTAAAANASGCCRTIHCRSEKDLCCRFFRRITFCNGLCYKEKRISGVIGCGQACLMTGLSPVRKFRLYYYYGLAGNRDMNYLEMHDLSGFFSNQTRVISYLRTILRVINGQVPILSLKLWNGLSLQTMNRKISRTIRHFFHILKTKHKTWSNRSCPPETRMMH